MPSQKIKMVLRAFRSHFETQQENIPMALRQESPDIVYTALLEDDSGPGAGPMPPMDFDASMMDMGSLGGEDPQGMVQQLLAASQPDQSDPMGAAQAAAAAPPLPGAAPGPGAGPGAGQGGPGAELAGLLSGMT